MRYRVYTPRFDDVLTGYMPEEEFQEGMEYVEFFREQDDSSTGSGTYELPLSVLNTRENQDLKIVCKFTADNIEFGYYGYEGWHPLGSTYSDDINGTEVVVDSMIPYYILENEEYEDDEYTPEPSKETIFSQILEEDHSFIDWIVDDMRESRE